MAGVKKKTRMSLAEFYRRLEALRGQAHLDDVGYIRFDQTANTPSFAGDLCPVERVDDAGRSWLNAGKALGLKKKDISDIIDAADNTHVSGRGLKAVDFDPRIRRIRRAMLNALGL